MHCHTMHADILCANTGRQQHSPGWFGLIWSQTTKIIPSTVKRKLDFTTLALKMPLFQHTSYTLLIFCYRFWVTTVENSVWATLSSFSSIQSTTAARTFTFLRQHRSISMYQTTCCVIHISSVAFTHIPPCSRKACLRFSVFCVISWFPFFAVEWIAVQVSHEVQFAT